MTKYPRGSKWRRWELHLHTPGTLKNDQFSGTSITEKWSQYYDDIKKYIGKGDVPEKNIAVIAITDYLSIDNYLKVKSDNNLPATVELVIPNVELRISPVSGSETPINIHCIFSPDIDCELEDRFFGKLKFHHGNSNYSATKSELIRLGRDFSNNKHMDELEARRLAAEQFVIPFSELKKLFSEDPDLREKTVIIVSNKSTDGASGLEKHSDYFVTDESVKRSQLQATRQSIYQMADAIFSSREKDIKYFTGTGVDSVNEVIRKCGCLMPCFHGCDAHENSKIFTPDQERFCWIKADPTFEGLKQALNEPQDRVFIGRLPEVITRVNENKTKYLRELFVDTIEGKDEPSNIWFKSNQIPLNNELVAIIGNKGSGKSALADIIGLCADAEHSDDFLFLSKEKFKKKGYAERFYANLQFVSGTKTEEFRTLSYEIKPTDLPKIQYLPQQYFETVCNEIGKVESFRKEIEKVVFQYIPDEQKLKKNSFGELIDFKKDSIDREIATYKNKIEEINEEIIILENKKNPFFKKSLVSKKEAKEEELRVHIEQKPPEKINPASIEETPEKKSQRDNLVLWESRLHECENQIAVVETEITSCAIEIEELKQFKRDVENKAKEVELFLEQSREVAERYSLDISNIFSIKYETTPITIAINQRDNENIQRKDRLGVFELPDNAEFEQLTLRAKLTFCNNKIKKIKATLSQDEQEYQRYLDDLKKWEQKKRDIEGSKGTADTLEYINEQISYIDTNLDKDLSEKRLARLTITLNIYKKKVEIKSFYDEIKSEIDAMLTGCQDQNQNQNLTIDSSFFLAPDFSNSFMSYINKSVSGSFRGLEEGKKIFQDEILSSLDPNQEGSIERFLQNIIEYLEIDKRDRNVNTITQTFIGDQVSKRADFYRFLFSLDYLESHYELRQNGKSLDKLSPGEKGALLLVFYLVLDKSEIPLVIDQPEDNLDNHSVAKVLVPFIKRAKKQRQIIMVTHNPNLAVVADAEQIIHVNIEKENGNKFSFISGSIENPVINQKIVDVLEGTMPAFTTRKKKYHE